MTPANFDDGRRLELLEEHLRDVAGRDYQPEEFLPVRSLMAVRDQGKREGRQDAYIDYARHLLITFFERFDYE